MICQALGSPDEEHALFTGVLIVYEVLDARGIFDLLPFMINYKKSRKRNKKLPELPLIFIDGDRVEPDDLMIYLEQQNIALDGELEGDILVQFVNDDRIFFEKYIAHLEEILTAKSPIHTVDDGHSLYPVYDFFLEVQWKFFPPREVMN